MLRAKKKVIKVKLKLTVNPNISWLVFLAYLPEKNEHSRAERTKNTAATQDCKVTWGPLLKNPDNKQAKGLFLKKPGNFRGPKANFKFKTC